DHGMAVESELASIRRVAAPVSPIGLYRLLQAAINRDLIEVGNAGVHQAARRLEENFPAVGRPADYGVVGRVEGQLFGRTALTGDDKNVVIAVAIGGEGNPLAIGREAGIDVPRGVHRDPLYIAAIFIGDPDVAEITEGDFAIVIAGMAQQLYFGYRPHA